MSRKRHKREEIVAKLREVDVLPAQGTPVADLTLENRLLKKSMLGDGGDAA